MENRKIKKEERAVGFCILPSPAHQICCLTFTFTDVGPVKQRSGMDL